MLAQTLARSGEEGSTADVSGGRDTGLPLDDLFDVLRNERRRIVLRYLATVDDEVRFGELVDHVAAAENDTEVGTVDSGTRKAVYTSLYQSHLPKLADLAVITHDRQSGPVAPGPHLDAVVRALDAVQDGREGGASDDQQGARESFDAIRSVVGL